MKIVKAVAAAALLACGATLALAQTQSAPPTKTTPSELAEQGGARCTRSRPWQASAERHGRCGDWAAGQSGSSSTRSQSDRHDPREAEE